MKLRRSERMVVISNYLINHPYELTSLNTFAERYESAKSSISEDIVIIKRAFEEMEIGNIETITGAGGGVVFTPSISDEESKEIIQDLCKQLSESDRILPGGYIYLSDLLSNPKILNRIGRIIAKAFRNKKIDAVMTVATKGVPLANAVANVLNVPFVIVRRDLKITEGSTVSVNYVSGSSGDRIEKMFLSKRSLKAGSRVLIVDDFLKGGGTINGMVSLLAEFDSELAGVAVFADNASTFNLFSFTSILVTRNKDLCSKNSRSVAALSAKTATPANSESNSAKRLTIPLIVPPPLRKSSTIKTRLPAFRLRFERNIFSMRSPLEPET